MTSTNENEQIEVYSPPIGAIMSKLSKTSGENKSLSRSNDLLDHKVRVLMATQFQTFGRLAKFDPSVFQEVLEYAEKNHAMIHIDSRLIGEYSRIGEYTNKKKQTSKAHFTKHGRYLQKCEHDSEKPIAYTGWFPYREYSHFFVLDTTKSEYNSLEDFLRIKAPK